MTLSTSTKVLAALIGAGAYVVLSVIVYAAGGGTTAFLFTLGCFGLLSGFALAKDGGGGHVALGAAFTHFVILGALIVKTFGLTLAAFALALFPSLMTFLLVFCASLLGSFLGRRTSPPRND